MGAGPRPAGPGRQAGGGVSGPQRGGPRGVATADERGVHGSGRGRLLGGLLPFAPDAAFTFVDLGAGTGAAARVLLDGWT